MHVTGWSRACGLKRQRHGGCFPDGCRWRLLGFSMERACKPQPTIIGGFLSFGDLRRTTRQKTTITRYVSSFALPTYQCLSLISTASTSTPPLNQRSPSSIFTSFPLICLFRIKPFSANVQSSSPYVRHHWPVSSFHSYQNWTAICGASSCQRQPSSSLKITEVIHRRQQTLLSVNANNSFLRRYSPSLAHFLRRNSTIASRPWRKVPRLRQIESGV